jgi:hypothetical protein
LSPSAFPFSFFRDGGADYWAIWEICPAEFAKFRRLFDASTKPGPDKRG